MSCPLFLLYGDNDITLDIMKIS